ncbi:MAG TPA: protein-L-isoaspartate(D-aspartate) O-methyltransferase [Wenzhouxiangellaceae bacterium]|nr:protein-L-isoaspartate(D-aspartate) O-methyltransferase [Wenzhouxiangellaceae bacterium]
MNAGKLARGIGMTSDRTRRRLIEKLREQGTTDDRVLSAMTETPRHMFVDEALSSRAYENSALPIGRGQTISQPLVVAMMTQAAMAADKREKALEIGTGSGYQAAVLARLFDKVFSTERIGELARLARQRLHGLKVHNVYSRHADGLEGWPGQAPFDAIVVTAGGRIPEALFEQLGEGGVLVAPASESGGAQELIRYTRRDDDFERESLGAVSFVPLLEGID